MVSNKNSSKTELFLRDVNSMDQNIFNLGKYIFKVYDKLSEKISSKYGINNFELNILFCLSANTCIDTARDLVDKLNLSKSNVSTAIDNLTKKGYLKGFQDENDRRYIHLKIQEPAKDILDEASKVHDEFIKIVTKDIPKEKLDVCQSVLEQIAKNMVEESKNM